jgi:hypothetical protein
LRADLARELADYIGGSTEGENLRRAVDCLREAVGAYNAVVWKFNRVTQNITLAAGTTFTLQTDFAEPRRCVLLDAAGAVQRSVGWLDPGEFLGRFTDNAGTGVPAPEFYTIENGHEVGQVTVWPRLGSTLTYPTMRLHYLRRILFPADGAALNVPVEVEQAIFDEAKDRLLAKSSGGKKRIRVAGSDLIFPIAVARRWQDFPDIEVF